MTTNQTSPLQKSEEIFSGRGDVILRETGYLNTTGKVIK